MSGQGINDRSDQPARRWCELAETTRAEFVRRVVAGETVKTIRAAMPDLGGFGPRTIAVRAREIRQQQGLILSTLPGPTAAVRMRVLADLFVRCLRWLFGAAFTAGLLREAVRITRADAPPATAPPSAGGPQ